MRISPYNNRRNELLSYLEAAGTHCIRKAKTPEEAARCMLKFLLM